MREKFGVAPALIPDYLALVGDAADGYPGIPGIGPVTGGAPAQPARIDRAASPTTRWAKAARLALLFKDLATLRTDAPLFDDAEALRVAAGRPPAFAALAERMDQASLAGARSPAPDGLS